MIDDFNRAAEVAKGLFIKRLQFACYYHHRTLKYITYLNYLEPKLKVSLQYDPKYVYKTSPQLKIKITLGMHEKLQALQDITLKSLGVFKRSMSEVVQCEEGITMVYQWHALENGVLPVTINFPEDHPFVEDSYN
jgi:hypothetical protein